jgi:hypothetical protein
MAPTGDLSYKPRATGPCEQGNITNRGGRLNIFSRLTKKAGKTAEHTIKK